MKLNLVFVREGGSLSVQRLLVMKTAQKIPSPSSNNEEFSGAAAAAAAAFLSTSLKPIDEELGGEWRREGGEAEEWEEAIWMKMEDEGGGDGISLAEEIQFMNEEAFSAPASPANSIPRPAGFRLSSATPTHKISYSLQSSLLPQILLIILHLFSPPPTHRLLLPMRADK
jgi:hypothetical protein